MTQLLVIKERLREIYQKYQAFIEPTIKFIVALVVLLLINGKLGYQPQLNKLIIVIAVSLLCAFTPGYIVVLVAAVFALGHIYAISIFLCVLAAVIMLILYVLFVRFTPKLGYVVLLVPVLYLLNLQYVVPILLGIIATPLAIIPVSCGVIIYYFFQDINAVAAIGNTTTNADDILLLYKNVMDGILQNKLLMLTLFTFAAVLLVTYLIRNLQINHAFETAILSGAIVTILVYVVGDLVLDAKNLIFKMIWGTILSGCIVYIIQFFKLTLDYSRVEKVQFEDDQYYYYVKAIPKVKVTTPEVSVKTINTVGKKTMKEDFDEVSSNLNRQFYEQDIQFDFSNLDDIEFKDNFEDR